MWLSSSSKFIVWFYGHAVGFFVFITRHLVFIQAVDYRLLSQRRNNFETLPLCGGEARQGCTEQP